MGSRKDNIQRRKEIIKSIIEKNYEPGNQAKSKLQIFRKHVLPVQPMSERTFWRYMKNIILKKNNDEN